MPTKQYDKEGSMQSRCNVDLEEREEKRKFDCHTSNHSGDHTKGNIENNRTRKAPSNIKSLETHPSKSNDVLRAKTKENF